MKQGTTPTHIFNVGIDKKLISKVKIIYAQGDKIVLTKMTEDCTIADKKISVKLTQEETLRFTANSNVNIQLRILTVNNDALVSNVFSVQCGVLLDKGVLE